MKIVINNCYGGFSISRKAAEFMAARGNERARLELMQSKKRFYGYGYVDGMDGAYERTDPDLVAAVEALGEEANGLGDSSPCLRLGGCFSRRSLPERTTRA